LQRAPPVPAPAGPDALVRPEAGQLAKIAVRNEHDVTAGAAVAAVRSAFRHVLLATERKAAVAAPPRLHVDAGAIVEHGAYSVTEIVRFSPLVLNATRPSRLAK